MTSAKAAIPKTYRARIVTPTVYAIYAVVTAPSKREARRILREFIKDDEHEAVKVLYGDFASQPTGRSRIDEIV